MFRKDNLFLAQLLGISNEIDVLTSRLSLILVISGNSQKIHNPT